MSSTPSRFTSNKFIFTTIVLLLGYLLLRLLAIVLNPHVELSGNYYSYEGKQVRYVCKGQGSPFVFFETGFGADSEDSWGAIIQKLPDTFTACYYDRLGHGGSDSVPTTFTTEQKSQLQESLITHVAGHQPVIVVGHSYGGIIARRTVNRAKLNLSALILLDSAHENQHTVLRGTIDPIPDSVMYGQYANAFLGLSAIKNMFKEYPSKTAQRLDQYYGSLNYAQVLATYRNEKGFYTPLAEFNYDFGQLKMLVLSHDKEAYANSPRFYSMVDKWEAMQKSLLTLSDNSERRIVKGATHNIPSDAPDEVVLTVIEVVSENSFAKNER